MRKAAKTKKVQNAQRFPWQIARDKHIRYLRVDKILQHEKSAEPYRYYEILHNAANSSKTNPDHKPALDMLAAIMEMLISDTEKGLKFSQFEPLSRWANGSRSAESDDFKGDQLEIIRKCSESIKNLVVRTRLEHLVWDLDRGDYKAGCKAIAGYIDILEKIYSGYFSVRGTLGVLSATSEETLHTLVNLNNSLGQPDSTKKEVIGIVKKFFERAYESGDIVCVLRFSQIFAKVDMAKTIDFIEKFISKDKIEISENLAELWGMLARFYRTSKNDTKHKECKKKQAYIYTSLADQFMKDGAVSAIEVARYIRKAIQVYHGMRDVRVERQKLRKTLVEVEKSIPAEMKGFSTSIDLSEPARVSIDEFKDLDLPHALLKFKSLSLSLSLRETMAEAIDIVSRYPFQSMFHSELIDDDGKTIAVSEGASVDMDGQLRGDLDPTIMRNEALRRASYEMGVIGPARLTVYRNHRVSRKEIYEILRLSPTVPPQYRLTLAEGFERYFNGDSLAAAYILVPMLEGIVRRSLLWKTNDSSDSAEEQSGQSELRSLSTLINTRAAELIAVYDDKIVEDIYRLFCAKWGPAIRHRVIHALGNGQFPHTADSAYACWLIWRLATFKLELVNE